MAGTLYLVGTPLGNLEDITYRAVRILREVDRIACEDTRRTLKLLNRYEITKPLVSYHEHNESARAGELIAALDAGENIAVVSDAGMPGVCDPGYRIVRAAIAAAIQVTPIPGPTAFETALAASGLPTDAFRFAGFLPPKASQRRKALAALQEDPATLVFYETPHRILPCLEDVLETLGEREIVVARELTKLHEEFLRGSVSQVRDNLAARGGVKGEITLLIARGGRDSAPLQPLPGRVQALIDSGVPRMDAIKQAAREHGISKRDAYRLLQPEAERYD